MRCETPLGGQEPESLCPGCLLAGALNMNLAEFHVRDLPSDPQVSYRPHTTVRLAQPEPTFGWALARRQFEHESSGLSAVPPTPPRASSSYEFRELLGIGGSGEVWRALQLSLGREVAVKRLHARHRDARSSFSARMLNYFKHEAYITARLDHPNIVPVYDLGVDEENQPLLAMKLVDGMSWHQILGRESELPLDLRLEKHLPVLVNVCQAVALAHARGVIHRDLKPSQVVIGKFGEVLLMDWGLAVPFSRSESGTIRFDLEYVPSPAGTVAFMAPEQTRQISDGLGPWTDIFLLGGILYFILTNTPPHSHEDPAEAFAAAATGLVEPVEQRAPDAGIPAELAAICRRALQREAEARFATVEELGEALQNYLAGTSARNESSGLTRRAVELFGEAFDDYMKLQASENLLTAALEIWPGNAEASRLRETVIRRSAELALEQGDLGVAETQTLRLADDEARHDLQEEISRKQVRRRRQTFQRRALLVTSLGLLIVALAIGTYSWRTSIHATRAEAEQRLSLRLAEQRIQEEKKRSRLLQATGSLRAEESRLSELLSLKLPFPDRLLYKDDPLSLMPEQLKELTALLSATSELERMRAGLLREGIPLGPEPFTLVASKARLVLAQASTSSEALRAYELALQAAQTRPDVYSGRLLLGVAAARADCFTSSAKHLTDAAASARQTMAPGDPGLRDIGRLHEQAYELAQAEMPREALIVESCSHGRNSDYYREISGAWFDSDAKSQAPGLGHYKLFKTRIAGPGNEEPVARFTLPIASPGRYHVYTTWGPEANAAQVTYTVQHAFGETVVMTTQDGTGDRTRLPFTGNSDLWVSLGAYDFTTTHAAFLEVRGDTNTAPPRAGIPQRLCADAVALTAVPLKSAILPESAPPSLSPYRSSRQERKTTGTSTAGAF